MNRKEAYEFCYENGARLMEIYNKDQLDILITYLGKFISDRSRYVLLPSKHSKLILKASDGIVSDEENTEEGHHSYFLGGTDNDHEDDWIWGNSLTPVDPVLWHEGNDHI